MRLASIELRVPPLALLLVAATSVIVAQCARGVGQWVPHAVAWSVAALAGIVGVTVALLGVIQFRQAQTTVDPRRPECAARLVQRGVYRWSRNPMYLGFVIALLALAVALQSGLGLAIAGLVALYLQRFQILPEERLLAQRFGDEFARYRERVRRWL